MVVWARRRPLMPSSKGSSTTNSALPPIGQVLEFGSDFAAACIARNLVQHLICQRPPAEKSHVFSCGRCKSNPLSRATREVVRPRLENLDYETKPIFWSICHRHEHRREYHRDDTAPEALDISYAPVPRGSHGDWPDRKGHDQGDQGLASRM